MDWKAEFESALAYDAFLERHAAEKDRARWREVYDKIDLTFDQAALLAGFTRRMNVLALVGAWCGDCVTQCPILQRIARESPLIDLRFVDRDANPRLQDELAICGGGRVPVAVFLSEDFYECARYGDRSISRYRWMAARNMGASCPLPVAPPADEIAAATADWLVEFERIQLMLLLSTRLRQIHSQ